MWYGTEIPLIWRKESSPNVRIAATVKPHPQVVEVAIATAGIGRMLLTGGRRL